MFFEGVPKEQIYVMSLWGELGGGEGGGANFPAFFTRLLFVQKLSIGHFLHQNRLLLKLP